MESGQLPHYTALEFLAQGGMGVVYSAQDTRLNRRVALKFLPVELTQDAVARERFMREARTASALDHPNICTIYEIGSTPDGRLFIAMPCYEGETLKHRLERGAMLLTDVLDVAIQVAQGLGKAHRARIVHRDIKPANLFVTTDGVVKILDFGIAKLARETTVTQTAGIAGTVGYMSPEHVTGEEVDERSDIWALGVVVYEMLTGARPFQGDFGAVLHAIINREPPPIGLQRHDVPPALERVVMRALAKRRGDRYASALELMRDLSDCRTPHTGSGLAGHPRTRTLIAGATGWRPTGAIAAGIGAAALAVATAFYAWDASDRGSEARDSVAALPSPAASAPPEPPPTSTPPPAISQPPVPNDELLRRPARNDRAGAPRVSAAEPRIQAPEDTAPTPQPVLETTATAAALSLPSMLPPPAPSPVAARGADIAEATIPQPAKPQASQAALDEEAIRETLRRYDAAYEALDLAAVIGVFPSLDGGQVEQLRKTFEEMRSYAVDTRITGIEVMKDSATVTAVVARRMTPRVGGPFPASEVENVFRLHRAGGGWRIVGVAVR